ncbi:DNA alkylation repair protein [Candidatus Saccharibacteria bacterium]|nr:DNA alkylation repair protein [Candidatus Saccharibacteria bacterium]
MSTIQKYNELKTALARNADDEYREFSMKGIPSERPFVGVRIPKIREIVAMVPNDKINDFLAEEPVAIEEVLARGMLISRLSYDDVLGAKAVIFDSQISYIDNWCTCDVFCSGLKKLVRGHRDEVLEQRIDPLLESGAEFAVRVGLVLLKCYYVDYDYLAVIFDRVEKLKDRKEYYIKMAIAWLVAECFIKYPEETLAYLKISHLPKWTYNKTISKICDSYRVEPEVKEVLKKMRK